MDILSLASINISNPPFNFTPYKSSDNNAFMKITNNIIDQYTPSFISDEMIPGDLGGLFAGQDTSLQSFVGLPQNSPTQQLLTARLQSNRQSAVSVTGGVDGTSKYDFLLAVKRSIIETENSLFNNNGGAF